MAIAWPCEGSFRQRRSPRKPRLLALRGAVAPSIAPCLGIPMNARGPSRALYAVGFQKNRPEKEMDLKSNESRAISSSASGFGGTRNHDNKQPQCSTQQRWGVKP